MTVYYVAYTRCHAFRALSIQRLDAIKEHAAISDALCFTIAAATGRYALFNAGGRHASASTVFNAQSTAVGSRRRTRITTQSRIVDQIY